jgi:archaemetzincin
MKSNPRFIYVVPLGDMSNEYLEGIAESIEEQFGLPVKIIPNQGVPDYAFDVARQQYNSNLILKKLINQVAPDGLKILGVTNVDLFNPIFSYVFGEAQFKGKGAVISSYRLIGNPENESRPRCPPLISRLEKEAIHELGHTFGLKHCADPDCVMQYSVGLECADRKFPFFCPACRDLMQWHLDRDILLTL